MGVDLVLVVGVLSGSLWISDADLLACLYSIIFCLYNLSLYILLPLPYMLFRDVSRFAAIYHSGFVEFFYLIFNKFVTEDMLELA